MARLKKKQHKEKEVKTGRNFVPSIDLGNVNFESLVPDKLTKEKLIEQINFFKNYKKNPMDFFWHELGISTEKWPNDVPRAGHDRKNPPLWSKQREIVQAVVKYRKVAVKSGHSSGKSYLLARLVLYLAYAWHALGITTAPTFRQVKRVLWGEIHQAYNDAPRKLGGKLTQTSLELGDKWFVEGFSTKDPAANIAGFHEETVFVAIDEAGGVENIVFDVIEGILTSPNSFVILIGNPLDEKGKFAEIFQGFEDHDGYNEKSGYYCITINCYDTPNVKHGINLYPKLCDKDWPDKMAEKWGRDSNLFRVKVLGQFPVDGGDVLIPFKYIQRAFDTYEEYEESRQDPVIVLGCDVARFGADSTTIIARRRSGRCDILEVTEKERETETVGRIVFHYENFKSMKQEPQCINVDDTGLGGGVVDMLWERGYPVNSIISQEGADEIEGDDRVRFANKRAQNYWKLRTAFHEGRVAINDWELGYELSKITTDKFLSEGRMKISDKDDLKKKIGRSPDRADCLMLCFAEDELISGQDLIAWI